MNGDPREVGVAVTAWVSWAGVPLKITTTDAAVMNPMDERAIGALVSHRVLWQI